MNTIQRVSDIIEFHADRPFLIDAVNDRVFSFGEFHRLACGLNAELRERGIRRSDRVAIILNNCIEFAVLYFACLYLGAVAVPVNPQLHRREIEFILRHSGTKMLIYSPSTKGLIPAELFKKDALDSLCLLPRAEREQGHDERDTWSIDKPQLENIDICKPFDGVSSGDLFTITFTSGTTSLPKGVAHRIDSLLQSAVLFNEALDFEPADCFYHVLPMSYLAGFLNTLLCPFLTGSSVVVSQAFDARLALQFWDAPIKYRANTLWLVPTILSTLVRIDRNPAALSYCRENIKTVCVGTAPLTLKLKEEFESKYGVELFESYGLSETLFVATNSRKTEYQPGSVGQVLPTVTLKIIGESGEEVPPGKDGEIYIRVPYLMAGYLNNQTMQPDVSDPGEWFPSGDIGHITSDGHLFITDRKKDLIIRGGINISPRAVEDVLMEHESVAQVAVIGLPHDFYGEEIAAVIKLKPSYALDTVRPMLEALCRKNLSPISIPNKFFEMDELPTSTTGKIQKAKLRELLATKPARREQQL